jgi:hypothetical protein
MCAQPQQKLTPPPHPCRWRFVAPVTGIYTFDTCGSSYDTYVHLYNRSGDDFLGAPVATCDDCGECAFLVQRAIK